MTLVIRPLAESDLPDAKRIMSSAFGRFLQVPDLESFLSDVDHIRTRWRADPASAFGAELDGRLVGTTFATCWGSVGFFGPLTIDPDYWDRGIAQQLMTPVVDCFERWRVTHAGLFTFPHSTKHIGLYQKFGFWPRFLTAILSKPVGPVTAAPREATYSASRDPESCRRACRALTDALYPGLDVSREIVAVDAQRLGDTVLVWDGKALAAFGVCHCGPGTEAGHDKCYVKFGAVRPGEASTHWLLRLLAGCEALAADRGLSRLEVGVNTHRHDAYRAMLAHGFRAVSQGVTMHRPNDSGYNRADACIVDDWR